MRSFQLIFIVVFLFFYSIISFGAAKSLVGVASHRNKRKLSRIFVISSILVILFFVILYVWPFTTRNLKDYSVHLIYNVILTADFVFKILMFFSFVIGAFVPVKSKKIIYMMGLILSLGMSSSVIYGSLFGIKKLITNNIELKFSDLPDEFDGMRILQISDIHLGNFFKSSTLMDEVLDKTKKINPDFVFFTGDMVNNFSNELEGWGDIFKKITENRKCFSVLGNHDYGNYTNWDNDESKKENFEKIIATQKTFGFELLDNSHVVLKSGNDSIYLIGVENWGHPPFPQYADLKKAMKGIPQSSFKILLSHDPAFWEQEIRYRDDINLTLSGHTHGFQWGIMKAGITFSFAYLARKNWGGLYRYKDSQLYVNAGLGTVGIPWRINMPAELTVFTLKRVEVN